MSNEKDPGCLGHFWGITLPSYVGIIIKHYKGPYKTASIMESNAAFFFFVGSHGTQKSLF